ncbi:hypothetical protein M404DRAFT_34814 [Pisolithus tinctorius Marx 270]|uniref:Tyr recombinase domain-containing protein n=1 Tax=Pisolithus tinctorius Marx 270 TaxID=870435 RepID=A0A0C3JAE1_PISTI|nr:hypothetical protein M404DRAFT_34814 [Pisolithus tinctorius Marx 270]
MLHITPVGVRDDTDRNGLTTTVFTLPSTKSSPRGEEVNWARQSGPSDPHTVYLQHLRINDPPANGPLFAYKKDRGHRPLTQQAFISWLKKLAKAAGHDHIHRHGLRIGATLEYLLRGIPFEVMKVKGRWASDSFQLYLRKHNQILAPYIQAMPTETATEFLKGRRALAHCIGQDPPPTTQDLQLMLVSQITSLHGREVLRAPTQIASTHQTVSVENATQSYGSVSEFRPEGSELFPNPRN